MRTRLSAALIVLGVALITVGPPILLHTAVYPVAIVRGNSMFPVLQNGELVVFRGVGDPYNIRNGTIIVFVEGDAPVNSLSYLVRPVVIHEVIGRIVNQYGRVYYETKGVNNPYPDPGLTPASNIVGTPVLEVPYAGFILLFFSSPEGLVALIGFLTVYTVEDYARTEELKRENRMRFLAPWSFIASQGGISEAALLRLSFLAQNSEMLANPLAAWLAQNIKRRWVFRVEECPLHPEKRGDRRVTYSGGGAPTLSVCAVELEKTRPELLFSTAPAAAMVGAERP